MLMLFVWLSAAHVGTMPRCPLVAPTGAQYSVLLPSFVQHLSCIDEPTTARCDATFLSSAEIYRDELLLNLGKPNKGHEQADRSGVQRQ